MSTWIKLENSIWENSKIEYISSECDMPLEMVVGIITRVWSWFDQHSKDGTTDRFGTAKINKIIVTSVTQLRDNDATSVTQQFIKCLSDVEWYKINADKTSYLPKWEEHNGATAKKRANDQKRQENHRNQEDTKDKKKKATSVTQECDELATREEKRREEKKELSNDNSERGLSLAQNPEIPTFEQFKGYAECHCRAVLPQVQESEFYEIVGSAYAIAEARGWKDTQGKSFASTWKSKIPFMLKDENRDRERSTQKLSKEEQTYAKREELAKQIFEDFRQSEANHVQIGL